MFLHSGREKRTFKTREDLGDYDDQYSIKRNGLDKHLIENVGELVRGDLERPTKRNEVWCLEGLDRTGGFLLFHPSKACTV